MNFKFYLTICLVLILSKIAKAQIENDQMIEVILESIAETAPEDFDYSELTERLTYYLKHPLNLNKATRDQLEELAFLSPLQINQFITHRSQNGNLLELMELQSIDSFDPEMIKKLSLFTVIGPSTLDNVTLKNILSTGKSDILLTFGKVFQKQKGYNEEAGETVYKGGAYRFLSRYKYAFGPNFSASLTIEKDAGETFLFRPGTAGFDFTSGSIAYKGSGKLSKWVIGDYSLQFGQGLTMWTGLSLGKGASVATITKNNIGLKQYTSTNELLFLRGTAASIRFKNTTLTPFISFRKLDGGVENINGNSEISSLIQSGFHRTRNELESKGTLQQAVYGANLQYSKSHLRLGFTGYQTRFSLPLMPGKQLYSIHEFSGYKLSNVGAYYNYNWKNFYVFGEGARSSNNGYAFLNGMMASLSPQVSLVMFHRDYQKNYQAFFNQAVSESSNAVNERGFYSGISIVPNKKIEWAFYADIFKFPWLRYRVDAPSSGSEFLSQLSVLPLKRFKIVLRYKNETKEENDELTNTENFLEKVNKENYRFEINYKISQSFQIRNRVEVIRYTKGTEIERGSMLFQDLIYNPLQSRLTGNLRFALFDTSGFNSRLYAYENDVLYSYSVPAYQNKGIRFYLNGRYRISKSADMWCKYAVTSYSDLDQIGTGPDQIEGNIKSDIKFQLRFQF